MVGKVSSLIRLAIAIRVWSVETAKILASYMENPNAPNNNGRRKRTQRNFQNFEISKIIVFLRLNLTNP